jgi:hypothetical protein
MNHNRETEVKQYARMEVIFTERGREGDERKREGVMSH